MPSQPTLPYTLIPYVSSPLPDGSLTLITSVLGATSNWLVLRFLYTALVDHDRRRGGGDGGPGHVSSNNEFADSQNTTTARANWKVVLVSFLRDLGFWKTEAKRLGLDLSRLADQGRFAFVDGLSDLFSGSFAPASSGGPTNATIQIPRPLHCPLPLREPMATLPVRSVIRGGGGAGPERDHSLHVPVATVRSAPLSPSSLAGENTPSSNRSGNSLSTSLRFTGSGLSALDGLEKSILQVIQKLKDSTRSEATRTMSMDDTQVKVTGNDENGNEDDGGGNKKILLVIDQPDFLLASTGPSKGIGAIEIGEWIIGLQQHVHSTILTMAADAPLVHNASTISLASFSSEQRRATPLEEEHAAFLIATAHRARMVMQLRNLDTGVAKDVSGVLRISKGGDSSEMASDIKIHDENRHQWEPKEILYHVQRDAGVRVFERGE